MPITPTAPGVYVTEVPSGNRTITGVATSITAFVGTALRGPRNTPVDVSSLTEFTRRFGGPDPSVGLPYAVRDFYLNGGGPAIIVRIVPSDASPTTITIGQADPKLVLTAVGEGDWSKDIDVQLKALTGDEAKEAATAQGLKEGDLFDLTIKLVKDKPDSETETYRSISLVDGPRSIKHVLRDSRLLTVTSTLPAETPAKLDAPVPVAGTNGAADPTGAEYTKAFTDLATVDLVNLLVLPPLSQAKDVPTDAWSTALGFAVEHRAFLLIDPPTAATTADARNIVAGLSGDRLRNAALYHPRIQAADPARGGALFDAAPSGAVAGVFARTDATRGVWKAPAGIEAGVAGTVGPSTVLTDADSGTLNQAGVNGIRSFRDSGTVVWGARTLRGVDSLADDYKYVSVRRLALYIEESLYRGTQWVVFEPNDEPLWAQIRLSVGSFMQDLFRKRALQGASPRQAYYVRCDGDTTTQYDIDRGIVNIEVGFAPLKPAEFVMISLQQTFAQE